MLKELLALAVVVAFVAFILSNKAKESGSAGAGGAAKAAGGKRKTALIIVDMQNDFLPPNGSLAVTDGDATIPVINKLRQSVPWDLIVLTQDFHPKDHCSFSVNNPGSTLFTPFKLPSGEMQMMWPAHCVQGSHGTEFSDKLMRAATDKVVQKGLNKNVDSYSGFYDNNHLVKSSMEDTLRAAGITDCVCTGLAYDYCVGSTAIDSHNAGFRTFLVEDATRGVAPASTAEMVERLNKLGVRIIKSTDIPADGLIN